MSTISKEELRRRRLQYFDKTSTAKTSPSCSSSSSSTATRPTYNETALEKNNHTNKATNSCSSSSSDPSSKTRITTTTSQQTIQKKSLQKKTYKLHSKNSPLYSLLWSQEQTNFEDKQRWIQQEITFDSSKEKFQLGLLQHHGGPCGVLATLLAEMVRFHYFSPSNNKKKKNLDDPIDDIITCFYHAIKSVLVRASNKDDQIKIVLPQESNWKECVMEQQFSMDALQVVEFDLYIVSNEKVLDFFVEHNCFYDYFNKEGGVFLFCLSLMETRSISQIQSEMDDSNSTLISQFGYASQEFLNLLLTGIATSNVFDHTIDLGQDTILRGIENQPNIGYLSQLEFLRYLSVGYFYKTPLFPIWIIGSSNHFSVLFCLDEGILEESSEEKVQEKVRRVFTQCVEDRSDENGFVKVESLSKLVQDLDLVTTIGGESGIQTLAAIIEINGAGIILWSDFWNIIRQLLIEKKTFQSILQQHDFYSNNNDNNKNSNDQNNNQPQQESDEEIARKLQAQWDAEDAAAAAASSAVFNNNGSSMEIVPYTNNNHGNDDAVMQGNYNRTNNNSLPTAASTTTITTTTATTTTTTDDNSFILYHYNGLHGGVLTKVRIILVPTDGDRNDVKMSNNIMAQDLEDVIKTKWPKCLFDWNV